MLYERQDDYDMYSIGDKRPLVGIKEEEQAQDTKRMCLEPALHGLPQVAITETTCELPSIDMQGNALPPMDIACMGDSESDLFKDWDGLIATGETQTRCTGSQSQGSRLHGSATSVYQQYDGRNPQLQVDALYDDSSITSNYNQYMGQNSVSFLPLDYEYSTMPQQNFDLSSHLYTSPANLEGCISSYQEALKYTRPPMSDQIGRDQAQALEHQQNRLAVDVQYPTDGYMPGSSSPGPESPEEQDKVCFGILMETIKTSSTQPKDPPDSLIEFRRSGDVLTLHDRDTGRYIGLLVNTTLSLLVDKYDVTLSATFGTSKVTAQKNARKSKAEGTERNLRPIRMTVHGYSNQKDTIADLLSEAGLYLQHPSCDEIGMNAVYDNPQYLNRPGSQMPVPDSSLSLHGTGNRATTDAFNEITKNYFMHMFDSIENSRVTASISPSLRLSAALKEHQQTAVEFMLEKEAGFVAEPKFPPLWKQTQDSLTRKKYRHTITSAMEVAPDFIRGGILADEMGLGKSLSLLALVCNSLDAIASHPPVATGQNRQSFATLIVTPKSTIPGWQIQIKNHIHTGCMRVQLYHGQQRQLSRNFEESDIVLTTYETLRSDWEKSGPLITQNWYRVVLDEAHHIRNRTSQLFSAACALRSQYRWCLTGTPIHNSLDDFGALLSFIRIQPFLSKSKFDYWISNAVKKNDTNSLHRLRRLIEVTCLRRTKVVVQDSCWLPERLETVERVNLSPADRDVYDFFKAYTARIASAGGTPDFLSIGTVQQQTQLNVITLINNLRLICNAGEILLPTTAKNLWSNRNTAMTDWQLRQARDTVCQMCGTDIEETEFHTQSDLIPLASPILCRVCTSDDSVSGDDNPSPSPYPESKGSLDTSRDLLKEPYQTSSAKIQALLRNLAKSHQDYDATGSTRPNKSVIFSVWTKMLDVIEQTVRTHGYSIQRIDGRTSLVSRSNAISSFNSDPNCTIMLASIGSTGEGVDLKAANTVHIIEPHWNPMVEAQAVDRVHRIGQDREVQVIRYVVNDSIESYVRWLQLDKIRMINQSVDLASSQQQQDINDTRWKKLRDSLKSH